MRVWKAYGFVHGRGVGQLPVQDLRTNPLGLEFAGDQKLVQEHVVVRRGSAKAEVHRSPC